MQHYSENNFLKWLDGSTDFINALNYWLLIILWVFENKENGRWFWVVEHYNWICALWEQISPKTLALHSLSLCLSHSLFLSLSPLLSLSLILSLHFFFPFSLLFLSLLPSFSSSLVLYCFLTTMRQAGLFSYKLPPSCSAPTKFRNNDAK